MGTSMEMIQNAYQGFSKQNYTMLDNLKLGYGGTQAEMQRLLEDAEKISGIHYDISSYSDIVDAIHVVQSEMGITGTTAKEASSTISGSVSSVKSSWSNLITGIADENADLDTLIGNFVDSIAIAGGNIIPRVEQVLGGIGTAITKLAPIIAAAIPSLVTNVLPTLLDAGVNLIDAILQGLITALPSLASSAVSIVNKLATTIIEQLPALIGAAAEVIVTLANGIAASLPELIPTIVDVVIQIVETLIDNIDKLIDAAIAIIIALADGLINALPRLIEKIPEIIEKLVNAIVNNAPKLLEAALTLIVMLAKGLITSIPELIKAIPQIVTAIVNGFASLMSKITGIGKSIVTAIGNGIKSLASSALTWGKDLIDNFVRGIKSKISAVTSAVSGIASKVKSFLGFSEPEEGPLSNFHTYAPDMMKLFAQGIKDNEKVVTDQIAKSFNFETATVGFESSGVGVSSAGIVNGINSGRSSGATIPSRIELVMKSEDGQTFGRWMVPFIRSEDKSNPEVVSDAV